MKISRKISLFFIIAILLSIFIVSTISSLMINNRFDKYLVEEQELRLKEISDKINQSYQENSYKLIHEEIDSYASLEDFSIHIVDLDGNILYSSIPKGMGRRHQRVVNKHGIKQGKNIQKDFPLLAKDKQVATLTFGYIDNSYLTEGALIFKNTLRKSLFLSAILAISVGIITSLILSKSVTKPLLSIRNKAVEIQKGNLLEDSHIKSNIIEIQELSDSINYLGESLANQEEIRNKYASNISHELRTPLTTLQSHLEAIIDGIWEPSHEHLMILMGEISRLSSLVDQLKDSFNFEEHQMLLNKSTFNLSQQLESIVTTYTPLFNKNNLLIQTNIEDNIEIYMDKDKLIQLMNNLLSNSIKYLDPGGEISLSLKYEGKNILIQVKDNGVGIPQKDLGHIFERFYRVDEARNRDSGGSGLGLSIVKSIVEAHKGTIEVKSLLNEGTEFNIYLPRKI